MNSYLESYGRMFPTTVRGWIKKEDAKIKELKNLIQKQSERIPNLMREDLEWEKNSWPGWDKKDQEKNLTSR
jgi:hypothetical protein